MTAPLLAILSVSCAGGPALAAGDAAKGKDRSSICAACHGVTGVSKQDVWPNLAAQKTGYIAAQLKAYRSGARQDPVMAAVAKLLSDEEIANLAAYFEQQAPSQPQVLGNSAATVTHEKREVD